MVVALNMFDELQDSGAKLDYDSLGRMLGVPMVPVEARNNRGKSNSVTGARSQPPATMKLTKGLKN